MKGQLRFILEVKDIQNTIISLVNLLSPSHVSLRESFFFLFISHSFIFLTFHHQASIISSSQETQLPLGGIIIYKDNCTPRHRCCFSISPFLISLPSTLSFLSRRCKSNVYSSLETRRQICIYQCSFTFFFIYFLSLLEKN